MNDEIHIKVTLDNEQEVLEKTKRIKDELESARTMALELADVLGSLGNVEVEVDSD